MRHFTRSRFYAVTIPIVLASLLTACGAETAPPLPTRTPAPTFTPAPDIIPTPVDPAAAATAQAAQPAPAQPAHSRRREPISP